MNASLKVIAAVVALAALLLVLVVAYSERWHETTLPLTQETRVELNSGESFGRFAQSLAQRGLIDQPELWTWRARLSGEARRVQAGEYLIDPQDTPATLLQRLVRGDVIRYEVQLLEGWTVRQVLARLMLHEALRQTLSGADELTLLGALGLPEGHAEGMFFPDTYSFTRGTSDADILRLAYRKLQDELSRAWATRAVGLPYETPYEGLIVASLVEKETGREEDRARIAQVFVSRLEQNMRLQTDPSVIYGVGVEFDGNLTRRHLRADTPYNTYTRKGLPPTPIALTGARSLEAALHPADGDYLYFVSRGDGTSQFSLSLEEHEAAVRRYQLR